MTREQLRETTLTLIRGASIATHSVQIELDTHLLRAGVLDSLAIVEVAGVIEREFEVSLPSSVVTPAYFQTVAAIADLIFGLKEKCA